MSDDHYDSRTLQDVKKELVVFYKIVFGDGEDKIGLIGRIRRIEDRLAIFWGALGLIGSATLVVLINFLVSLVKGK